MNSLLYPDDDPEFGLDGEAPREALIPFPPLHSEVVDFVKELLLRGTGRRREILTRLFLRTDIKDCGYETPCWVWTGGNSGIAGRGCFYGRVSFDGQTHAVHRLAYQTVFGPISPKKHVDHLCFNRLCWNPDHLDSVTHRKNMLRRDAK